MSETSSMKFISSIAGELSLKSQSIHEVVVLLEAGNTIPFIARYRKEATGNLDEVQIKTIQERYAYLKELDERKKVILSSIESQGKLTDALREQITECQVKTTLEDLYLPYKPKRRTRAMIAKEKGLEPLADLILEQPRVSSSLEVLVHPFISIDKGVEDIEAALSGARDIVAEKISENLTVRSLVREAFRNEGIVKSKVRSERASQSTKFDQYYDFKEAVKTIPSHRYLAIRRGEREEVLDFSIEIEPESVISHIEKIMGLNTHSVFCGSLKLAVEDAFKRLINPSVETDMRVELKMSSDRSAVTIFADNLKHLLLAAPMGGYSVLGIDPGIRTGCKCAVVDETGKYINTVTIYLSQGDQALQQAKKDLKKLIETYHPYAIAIGNGTAGRETETFVRSFLKENGWTSPIVILVNESGASVYSASEVARDEFPELDLTIRGAISIARRLQDPLAELVKIEPKSIGVGQYQHDVHQPLLQDELQHVVESCVNHIGVDLNTASGSLLNYVSGIGPTLAKKVIKYREENGAFKSRSQLRDISGFGPKTFEQAAGFLRIRNGENPLDASAVHPERYDFIEQMARDLDVPLSQLICNPQLIDSIDRSRYQKVIGEHTLADIIQELKKPGRDPRECFAPPSFREDILTMEDLKVGMKLEGVVTNVTAFGAFVDIGVHQDGLIHLSELSDKFITNPQEVVKAGDKIAVEVLQIEIPRKRISLTARIGQKRQKFQSTGGKQEQSKVKAKQTPPSFYTSPFNNF